MTVTPDSDTTGVRILDVHFTFGGPDVLRGVDLDVRQGSLVTIFGPNGAGKTTLLKILSGLLRPSRGTVTIAGMDATGARRESRRSIGLLSHQTYLYPQLTGRENLEFYARLYALPDPRSRAIRMLGRIGLTQAADKEVAGYSRGMQQRLAVARALLHDPDVLLLDEPFTGLDQEGRQQLSDLLRSVVGSGRTAVMTTHDMQEGLSLSDRVAILARGLIAVETAAAGLDRTAIERLYREAVGGHPPSTQPGDTAIGRPAADPHAHHPDEDGPA